MTTEHAATGETEADGEEPRRAPGTVEGVPVDELFECLVISAQTELVERFSSKRLAEFAG
ncbi:hypothetical protein ACFY4C_22410 [Actinomadura viridis]|uniref:hypothetical protein n=1 Tax=Actinomadura viridis TaxID=58110 RepID=UPI003688EB12